MATEPVQRQEFPPGLPRERRGASTQIIFYCFPKGISRKRSEREQLGLEPVLLCMLTSQVAAWCAPQHLLRGCCFCATWLLWSACQFNLLKGFSGAQSGSILSGIRAPEPVTARFQLSPAVPVRVPEVRGAAGFQDLYPCRQLGKAAHR